MTSVLARGVPFRDACRIARTHPGSFVKRDDVAFVVAYRQSPDHRPGRDVRSASDEKRSGSAPRRPAPSTGLPGPPAHYSVGAPRPSARPSTATSAQICPHGKSALLCDICWTRQTGGPLN